MITFADCCQPVLKLEAAWSGIDELDSLSNTFEWGVFVFVFGFSSISVQTHKEYQNQTFELKDMNDSESGMKWCDGVSSASCAVSALIFLSSVQVGLGSQ